MERGFLQRLPSDAPVAIAHALTRIGRGAQCEFQVISGKLGREHSLVIRRSDGFWVCDLHSSYGTWLSRGGAKPTRIGGAVEQLLDGDVIGLHDRVRFIRAEPDPDAESPSTAEALFWPGTALTSPDLRLSIEWHQGRVRGATIEEVRLCGNELTDCVRALIWSPAAEGITKLEVVLLPAPMRFTPGTLAHSIVEEVRDQLERSRLPSLRRLRLSAPLDLPALRLPGSPLLER